MEGSDPIQISPQLGTHAPWRPHVYEADNRRGWQILTSVPESQAWMRWIERAKEAVPELSLGICGPTHVITSANIIDSADRLQAAMLPLDVKDGQYEAIKIFPTASDLIYERDLKLDHQLAQTILERGLQRAQDETNSQLKGVLLEVVAAVLLSQVAGWEIKSGGISRRSQQIDVVAHNRNVGGVLGRSPVIMAEVKNWGQSVKASDYSAFQRKLASSSGLAKLGFFMTTSTFTEGAYIEAIRDTKDEILIVLLDKRSFPAVWRESPNITQGIERMILEALEDQRQRLGA